jgi:hypothetical protein
MRIARPVRPLNILLYKTNPMTIHLLPFFQWPKLSGTFSMRTHPNKIASARMADVWLNGIMEILESVD